MLICFIAIIGLVGTQYFLGVNLTASIQNLFSKPEVDIAIVQQTKPDHSDDSDIKPDSDHEDTPDIKPVFGKTQPYHIPGKYDFVNAKAICKAYNGKLANIQQMMDAYEKGADWCDYGWSDGHMALYPTQMKSWHKYQEEGHPEKCGRPGINGGYVNKKQKLGVNCFGKKPPQTQSLPPVVEPSVIDARVEYWKSQLPKASPFNYSEWSE